MRLTEFESRRVDELAPATLASYKTKAGAAATAADAAGDVKTADKRFSGIVKATKKQFDQDAKGVSEDNLYGGRPDDEVKFFIDSEPAYYAVIDRFGDHIEFRGDDMVAPLRLWSAIQQTAGDAGGAADIAGLEDEPMWVGDELDEQGVAEADDSKFVGFMNKTMSDKVDAPKADTLAAAPAFYRNAAVSTLDARQGFKNALKFGLKALSRLDSETRQQLAAGSEQEVEEYLTDVAERSGQMGDDTFVEEDISEVQDYLSDVFHDPSINSWKDVLQQSRGVAEDDDAVAAFLARGGEIQQLKPQRGPKRSGVGFASKHIGSASGRGNTKGKVSGLGANTGKAGKPVVTAEQGVAEDALAGMKRLAGIAPITTQTTPGQRQYRHMPTAVQSR